MVILLREKLNTLKKQFQDGIRSKTIDTTTIGKKINKEMSKTKEGKNLEIANKNLEAIFKSAEAQGISRSQVVFNKEIADVVNDINNAYDKKFKEIGRKYADEFASTTLRSLGYEDTKVGRDWLKKQNFMDW